MINYDFWKNKKVLITGHTGFKGSWLSIFLKSLDCEIFGLSRETIEGIYEKANLKSIYSQEFFNDISSENFTENFKEIKKINPDIVFHFAAQSLVYKGYQDPLDTLNSNIIGTFQVLNEISKCSSTKSAIVSTTDKVYKNSDFDNVEESPLGGKDFYSSSKVGQENVIEAFSRLGYELNISVVRSGNVIGGGDRAEKRLATDLIESLISNKDFVLRKPHSIRPWQYVFDSIYGYLLVAQENYSDAKSEIYNLNSEPNNKYDAEYLARKFIEIWASNIDIKIDKNEEFKEVDKLIINSSKAKHALGWEPKTSIDEMVNETVMWEKKHLKDSSPNFSISQVKKYLNDLN